MHLSFMQAELDRLSNRKELKIRSQQKATILREIGLMKEPSRRAIVKSLSIRSSTISSIIDDLIDSGVVKENGRQVNDRGRPRLNLAIASDSRFIISIYAEHFQLIGGLVNLQEKVFSETVIEVPQETECEAFINLFDNMIER